MHTGIPDDAHLREHWNRLVDVMERPQVFYTYEWALAVSRAYAATLTPLVMLLYDEESLLGVASLATGREPGRSVFLANTTADYCDFVSHPRSRATLIDAVLQELKARKLSHLTLANFPSDSESVRALQRSSSATGYATFSRPAYFCAQVSFATPEAREAVAKEVRGKQMVKRHRKSLSKIGRLAVDHLTSPECLAQVLPQFAQAHVERFLATGRMSNLVAGERRKFLAELVGLLSPQGWVVISRLNVGERSAAWNYGFRFRGSWFWYQPCFDSTLQRFWPGYCLLAQIVEDACATPDIDLVDLGLGEEGYKDRFTNGGRRTLHMTVSTARLDCFQARIRHLVGESVRMAPRLESAIRKTVRRGASLKDRMSREGLSGTANWLGQRSRQAVGRSEVQFFSWHDFQDTDRQGISHGGLEKIDLGKLADAAMCYVDDPEAAGYMIRCAARLQTMGTQGFLLRAADETPVHFCWVSAFERFYLSELDHTVQAPTANSVIIFDCWTPKRARGRGYYGKAIALCARQLQAAGQEAWIFSSSNNTSSIRGIFKAGFVKMFSLSRNRPWFLNRVKLERASVKTAELSNVSAAD